MKEYQLLKEQQAKDKLNDKQNESSDNVDVDNKQNQTEILEL